MRRNLTILFVLLLLLASCGGNRTSQSKEEVPQDSTTEADSVVTDSLTEAVDDVPMPKAADELFDDFIFNFAASRKLQMERIVFPLPVLDGEKKQKLRRADWQMEYFFMHQGYYALLFDSESQMEVVKDTSVHHAVVEKIIFEEGNVTQYIFDRIRGIWMMTSIHTVPVEEAVNASFLSFFHRFVSDMEFQISSLEETVGFVGPDPDDDFSQMEGVITPDTWEAFAPDLPTEMFYTIVYGHAQQGGDNKVFVLRGIANGYELQMNFRRKGDKWKLTKLIT